MGTTVSRRRFLTISAAAGATLLTGLPTRAASLHRWQGAALGARASILIDHPEAARITAACRNEIGRLEDIFSLYRTGSALSRLNAQGHLASPPPELLECLSLASAVHAATGGLFDPTIQPLWALYAEQHANGRAPRPEAVQEALTRVGWSGVEVAAEGIRLARPGMALSLNGIAQGYIADRVAALLRAEGLTDILIDTGEHRALGGHPNGGAWQVELEDGMAARRPVVGLRDRALASSAPKGTVFDAAGTAGHILHPRTGVPATVRWRLLTVSAPGAALADALSTAFCLMTEQEMEVALEAFPEARIMHKA